MHELSVAMSFVEQVEEILKKENSKTLLCITLELGELSGIERDAFEFALPFAMQDSSFRNVKIVINEIKAEVFCKECQKNSLPDDKYIIRCPICLSQQVTICKGREFIIKSMEFK